MQRKIRRMAMQILPVVLSSGAIKHFDFQKLAGLWLADEVVNRVGIYGSKAADYFSAFQRRSCLASWWTNNPIVGGLKLYNAQINATTMSILRRTPHSSGVSLWTMCSS